MNFRFSFLSLSIFDVSSPVISGDVAVVDAVDVDRQLKLAARAGRVFRPGNGREKPPAQTPRSREYFPPLLDEAFFPQLGFYGIFLASATWSKPTAFRRYTLSALQ
jgi:hypothetical protein